MQFVSRRHILLSLQIIFLCLFIDTGYAVAESNNENAKNSGDNGKEDGPIHFIVVAGKDDATHFTDENGGSVILTLFYFDPKTKQVSRPEGPSQVKRSDEVPIPVEVFIQSLLSGRPAISGVFANSIGKLSGVDDVTIAAVLSENADMISTVDVVPSKDEEFFIAPDYIIYPNKIDKVKKPGPYATIVFKPKAVAKPLKIVVKRNNKVIKTGALKKEKDISLQLDHVKKANDLIEWEVKDGAGKVAEKGALGFPISSAVPNLVFYTVNLAN